MQRIDLVFVILVFLLFPFRCVSQAYLAPEEYALLTDLFATHLNYFLSPEVITSSGLPLTAYKVGNRARYNWSNPTEWGYAMQAWIAAAERGRISEEAAVNRITLMLDTMCILQLDPEQNHNGLFYPYYRVLDPNDGHDLAIPFHDHNLDIPSGDNALLYASLLIAEGWAKSIGNSLLQSQVRSIGNNMTFHMFLFSQGANLYLAHTKTANSGELKGKWDVYADEGGVVAWIAYLSGSVTFEEYKKLTESQKRQSASWASCIGESYTVQEAAWFNAMFTWSVRSLAGFPIGEFDAPGGARSLYSPNSLVPNVKAHLAYGDCLVLLRYVSSSHTL